MIVVDTSALVAILLGEPQREACLEVLSRQDEIYMSAATLAEAYIVTLHRDVGHRLKAMVEEFQIAIVPVTAEWAYEAGEAYRDWGKGRHPAKLNYGDCFSYAAARHMRCPLLFIGNDFSQTDIASAL